MAAKAMSVCRNCGGDFEPYRRGVQQYCTPCRNRAAKEATKTRRIRCKECGKRFTTAHRTVRYCSAPCRKIGYDRVRSAARNRPHRLLSGTADCRICGKAFKIGRGHGKRRVFCSDKCRAEGRKIRNREDMRKYLSDPKKRAIQRARSNLAITRQRARDKEERSKGQKKPRHRRPQPSARRPKNRGMTRGNEGRRQRQRRRS